MSIRTIMPILLGLTSVSCRGLDFGDTFGALEGDPADEPVEKRPSLVAQTLLQKNLVSDQPGVGDNRDPHLINAWGLAFGPEGPAWVADNGSGFASVYDARARLLATVTIPSRNGAAAKSTPTGQVYNGDAAAFAGDRFIFVTEEGTVVGWQPGFDGLARQRVDNSPGGAVYKGVSIAHDHGATRLYAADFHNGRIDVLDANYQPIAPCEGAFTDKDLPANYAPFNVFAFDDLLLVAYAKQQLPERVEDDAGKGRGFIELFDASGHLLERLISRGVLDSPWGMAVAPEGFGRISKRLLVGNFGDGRINVFGLALAGLKLTASFEGFIGDTHGDPLAIDGLWALGFPPSSADFDGKDLYFTAGPNEEESGLFGRLVLPPATEQASY
ncbi:MAG TPA: TIGR03118 family protein [Polyangiaceae bacterium]|nr:TIGR03118 family protein [Polyangiaceae bacterium]